MENYNKIMIYVWLTIAIGSAIGVTIMGFLKGFDIWFQYYFITIMSLLIIWMKRVMMKRFEKNKNEFDNRKK